MKIVKKKYKVIDLQTGGVKIIGYDKMKWYKDRNRYNVEEFYGKSKTLKHFMDAFSKPLLPYTIILPFN